MSTTRFVEMLRLAMNELPLAPFDIWVAKGQLFFNQLDDRKHLVVGTPRALTPIRSRAALRFHCFSGGFAALPAGTGVAEAVGPVDSELRVRSGLFLRGY